MTSAQLRYSSSETASRAGAPFDASSLQPQRLRITSIDALRGFVMFTMIFVNDLAGADEGIVPNWMKHASDIHPRISNGMTFVDLVFPAFLFIVGSSIPFALGGRIARGERWRLLPHILIRTASLLLLGVLMVNGAPDATKMPWYHAASSSTTAPLKTDNTAATLWTCFMFLSAFLAFCQLSPFWVPKSDAARQKRWRIITLIVRGVGFACLAYLIFIWQKTSTDRRTHATHVNYLFTWSSGFSIRHSWWDILGLIAWAYLVGSLLFLIFRTKRLPLAVATAILLGFWIADRSGSFDHFALPGLLAPVGNAIVNTVAAINRHVGIGECLGSLAAITAGGVLLSTVLLTPESNSTWSRVKFTLMFIAATALAALVVNKPWGIWKNSATPAWCLWAMSTTAALWLVFYLVADASPLRPLAKPLAIAGQNVLLAYLISEGLEAFLRVSHLGNWYGNLAGPNLSNAIGRSAGCAAIILIITALLNRLGFRLKL